MRRLQGEIISHKMIKTAVVRVDELKKHGQYQKYYRASKHIKAHDERDEYRAGDRVIIEETRPLSREKRWKIIGLIRKNKEVLSREDADSAETE